MWTPEFQTFVAPARAKAQLWRTFVGIVLTAVIYGVGIMVMLMLVWANAGNDGLNGWMQRIANADTPTAVILMLATFVGMAVGTFVSTRVLHGRSPKSLFGAGLVQGFAVAAVISALVFGALMILLPASFELVRNTPANLFLSFLPLALFGLLIQTGAEEILFRGYLQQQMAARFDHWIVWMILPSALFGLLHYDPGSAGDNAWWMVAAATLFGIVAADLTRVTGSIGAAWGVHFVNNVIGVLVISLSGSLSGLSWWTTSFTAANTEVLRPLILQDMVTTVIVWAAIRLWLARRDMRDAAA